MAREKLTPREAVKLAAERVLNSGIRGISRGTAQNLARAAEGGNEYLDHLSVEWERAWAVSADLTVSASAGRGVKVAVNWSSTERTPGAARAAAALYAEVVDLACELEAFLGGFDVRKD